MFEEFIRNARADIYNIMCSIDKQEKQIHHNMMMEVAVVVVHHHQIQQQKH